MRDSQGWVKDEFINVDKYVKMTGGLRSVTFRPGAVYLDANYIEGEKPQDPIELFTRSQKDNSVSMVDVPSAKCFQAKNLIQDEVVFETYIVDVKTLEIFYVVRWSGTPIRKDGSERYLSLLFAERREQQEKPAHLMCL